LFFDISRQESKPFLEVPNDPAFNAATSMLQTTDAEADVILSVPKSVTVA